MKIELDGVAPTTLTATGWSSGPKREGTTHAQKISSQLHVVFTVLVEHLAKLCARAEPGDEIKLHIRVNRGGRR